MTRRTELGLLLVAAFLLVFLAAGCQQAMTSGSGKTGGSDQRDSSVLNVGVTANAPPYVFKQDGKLTGLEVSFAMQLGRHLNRAVNFVEVPWDKQFDYLKDGKTDIIMSGMTITEQRSYLVDFVTPYMRSGQIMLVRMQDRSRFAGGINSVLNTNYRLGTVANTVSDFFVSSVINGANEVVFQAPEAALSALINDKIDAFIYDAPVLCYFAAQNQQDKLIPILDMGTEEYLGWAVRKGDAELLAGANSFMDSLQADGRLQQVIKRWIPYLYR
jgi:polar amino acid transport system substrate-binding protein